MSIKRAVLLCLLIVFLADLSSAEERAIDLIKPFNFGVRFGGNAPYIEIRNMYIDGKKYDPPSTRTSIGYVGSIFARYNIKRHFIQLEASTYYNQSHTTLESHNTIIGENTPENSTINITSSLSSANYTIDVPLFYGYNFIHKNAFLLNFFVGTKFKFPISEKDRLTTNIPDYIVEHDIQCTPVQYYVAAGMSSSIGHFYIDFRYEYCLKTSKRISYQITTQDSKFQFGEGSFSRRIHELNLSIGYFW